MKRLILITIFLSMASCSVIDPFIQHSAKSTATLIKKICSDTNENARRVYAEKVNVELEDTPHFWSTSCNAKTTGIEVVEVE
jgi:hypothetical protein